MRDHSVRPRRLNTERLTLIFAAVSLVFVAALAVAPLRGYFAEWRRHQQRYNALAMQAGASPVPVALQQIWRPELGVTDRCVTCHLGMGTAGPLPGDPLFAAHPPIPHDPQEFGCTVCHGGQGRATTTDAAHGFVSHWDDELLGGGHRQAGCGTCHDRLPTISRASLERGQRLVERYDCLSCHRLDGRGRGSGPDLSYVGLTGYRPDWHAHHLAQRAVTAPDGWTTSYGDIPASEVGAITAFLDTRAGAPVLVEAQALALEKGCLGCHKLGGRGGDEGPALDGVGRKPKGDLSFAGLQGPETLASWMKLHLLDPADAVPGSLMPAQPMTDAEADLLTTWLLSLRARELPVAFVPAQRIRRAVLGETPPPMSGEEAYRAYCSACHGPDGEGRNFGNLDMRFPAIGTPDFVEVASPAFIRTTLEVGRPGRRMPALAGAAGSLTPDETTALVGYLAGLRPPAPPRALVAQQVPDVQAGRQIYDRDCAACHGAAGEGTPLGPPLATSDAVLRRDPQTGYDALVNGVPETAMPAYGSLGAGGLRSLLAAIEAMPVGSGARAGWRGADGDPARGEAVFAANCAGCHGPAGEGKTGPALANGGFLQAATPAYVSATTLRGRAGTPMPAFGRPNPGYRTLSATDVLDVTAFVMAWKPTTNDQ